jgi:hypothetical protein
MTDLTIDENDTNDANDANDANDECSQVILGDESSNQSMSFQLAQAFYNEITGKSERVKEEFNSSFILTMDNVNQLHNRIIQSSAQYNIVSANASFSVIYYNDSSERFSSIERFMAHAGSKGIAVEEVDITYRLLVILPLTNKPQEYNINIKLISRCAKVESMREDIKDLPMSFPLWQFEGKVTCRASIDFVDITVSNAFMSVIKSWNDCLEVTEMNSILKNTRHFSKYFPSFCHYSLLATGVFFTFQTIDLYFTTLAPESTAKFVLLAILANYLLVKAGRYIGIKAERNLDQIYQPSYIRFSGADDKLAKNTSSNVRTSILRSIGYISLTLVLGGISSVLASLITT